MLPLVAVSQPLPRLPSQSAKLSAQVRRHTPAAHAGVALAVLHALPQRPQAPVLVLRLVSQPLAGIASQSAKPALQRTMAQRPAPHDDSALGSEHAAPQVPQWAEETSRSVSQPLLALPSQSPSVEGMHTCVDSQRPALHRAPAPGNEQRVPQAPQWVALVPRLVSQPLLGSPSQSPKPSLQRARVHAPAAQPATPLATTHALPQAPQWAGAVASSTSQPLAGSPSQSAKPASQVAPQRESSQVAVACGRAGQALRHAPQWAGLAARSTSQPLAAAPSQLPKPVAQTTAHAPLMQAGVELGAAAQVLPQAPQWGAAEVTSVSQPLLATPSQSPTAVASSQRRVHTLATQTAAPRGPPGQRLSHAPQLPGSLTRLTQVSPQRSGVSPEQATAHEARRAPPVTVTVHSGLAPPQTVPQAPQWSGRERSASQPLVASPSQSPKPGSQVKAQPVAPQAETAWAGAVQTVPQAPQWRAERRSVSQPSTGSTLQSPRPVAQARTQAPALQLMKGLMTSQS